MQVQQSTYQCSFALLGGQLMITPMETLGGTFEVRRHGSIFNLEPQIGRTCICTMGAKGILANVWEREPRFKEIAAVEGDGAVL
jgi:hypothetical protein